MEAKLSKVPQEVVAKIVKLAQEKDLKGSSGGWKEFVKVHEKRIGCSLSDPSRRSRDTLISFLCTFTHHDSLKFVDNVLRVHSNRESLKNVMAKSSDNESPEQRLVRLTIEHPKYITNYAFLYKDRDWVVTKLKRKSMLKGSHEMLAVDCEMVSCEDGTEGLVRVCVVDRNLQVKLEKLVNPGKPVADYRSHITGVSKEDLDGVTCSLADVQEAIAKLLSKGTILVGHSLYNDLKALRIDHQRVVDTSFMFKKPSGGTPSLSSVCKAILGYELRKEDDPHNCLDDACAAMKIVLAMIERGVDTNFPLIEEEEKDVPVADMAKLLIHNIKTDVSSEDLVRIFPKNFKFALEPLKKGPQRYSMSAIFKNSEEAHLAFEDLVGSLKQDTAGLPQKLVTLNLKTGSSSTFYVRKMTEYYRDPPSTKKRPVPEINYDNVKRIEVNECDNHLKEIERLKEELREKDSKEGNTRKRLKICSKKYAQRNSKSPHRIRS